MGDINLDDMVNAIIEVRNKMIKKKIVEELGVQIVALQAQLAERDAEIERLRAQVETIERYFRNVSEVEEYVESRQDFAAIMSYLFPPVR